MQVLSVLPDMDTRANSECGSTGHSSEECKVLWDYRENLRTRQIVLKNAFNKRLRYNNKTEVNNEELNTTVKKAVAAAIKEKYRNAPKCFQQTSINLATNISFLALTT